MIRQRGANESSFLLVAAGRVRPGEELPAASRAERCASGVRRTSVPRNSFGAYVATHAQVQRLTIVETRAGPQPASVSCMESSCPALVLGGGSLPPQQRTVGQGPREGRNHRHAV